MRSISCRIKARGRRATHSTDALSKTLASVLLVTKNRPAASARVQGHRRNTDALPKTLAAVGRKVWGWMPAPTCTCRNHRFGCLACKRLGPACCWAQHKTTQKPGSNLLNRSLPPFSHPTPLLVFSARQLQTARQLFAGHVLCW